MIQKSSKEKIIHKTFMYNYDVHNIIQVYFIEVNYKIQVGKRQVKKVNEN